MSATEAPPTKTREQLSKDDREKLLRRLQQLRNARSSWLPHWQDLSDYLLPFSGRFFVQDRNLGNKRHSKIYDNTGTRAVRILAAGLMAGATSPARPWFRLALSDAELSEALSVRVWLDDVARRMLRVFQRSNTYRALHQIYEELGTFGTGACIVMPDFDNVIHLHPVPVGEFCIATDHKQKVNALFREFEMTVAQVVREFGLERCSMQVQQAWRLGNYEDPVQVCHAIEPREERDHSKQDNLNMAWRSVYLETGAPCDDVLRDSGFERFPVLAPRWATTGGDCYGNSSGMDVLGDVKQLQHEQLRKAQSLDHQLDPPLQVPASMRNRDVDRMPGGITPVDSASATAGIRSMYQVDIRLDHLLLDIQDVRRRIEAGFYADLFLMLTNASDTTQRTAAEIAERHEEKLLMLGPVLERLHNELLEPLISLTFHRMMEVGAFLPPPPEVQGMDMTVEFVSMLAQAQRAIGTNGIDRYIANLGVVAQLKPDVLDNLNADEWASHYSDMLAVPPKLLVPPEDVAALRDARNKALAAKEQAATMESASASVRNLAGAPTDPAQQTALTDAVGMFSGYGNPAGG